MGNNKTLIITVVNKAYVEGEKSMLDLFLDSFWLGDDTQFLVNHLLIVAMDQIAYDRCMFLRRHCYRLVTDGVDFGGEKLYMSNDFVNMMWRRTLFLANVLQRGYNFIFTDTDILWLGNPFTKLSKDESEDIQISVDWFNGNPRATTNPINTGFYFVRSNNKTISLFETWYAVRNESDYIGMKEQDVIEKMMRNGVFKDMGIKAMFLDTDVFSGFCHDSKDFRSVVTVHANCCRSINAKVADLMVVFRDWRRYKSSITADSKNMSVSNAEKRTLGWSKHVACLKSWENLNGSSS
ncbi:Nucleotide-diphospho-sugar transferase family protein [Thalictrum thalictroides]|uniref:Nucleotide-diphospho-sugar transferase family protein n=1 Tax=Thalictrum thalictroides TaxID=46969 RepID=A0A7J6WNI2_THATH|nr:Nucleotide-diphospho-sugar transferase family protein [Thalictrum thalictroides]